jgi:putative endonuclease
MVSHVYILFSSSLDQFYIGQTANLAARLRSHLDGLTPETSRAKDWQVIFLQRAESRGAAMKLEAQIKKSKTRKSIRRYIKDIRNEIQAPIASAELASPVDLLQPS